MTLAEFHASLTAAEPPAGLNAALRALWWDAKGDWHAAHDLIGADESGRDAAWVHAYLHRKEGDLGNAGYWYARARRPMLQLPLIDERAGIAAVLLAGERA
jgi:hypothetical protein